jgi:hypothetical protein
MVQLQLTTPTQKHAVWCPACLQAWLKQPLIDVEAISGRHDVVEAMVADAQLRADLRSLHLRGEGSPSE